MIQPILKQIRKHLEDRNFNNNVARMIKMIEDKGLDPSTFKAQFDGSFNTNSLFEAYLEMALQVQSLSDRLDAVSTGGTTVDLTDIENRIKALEDAKPSSAQSAKDLILAAQEPEQVPETPEVVEAPEEKKPAPRGGRRKSTTTEG